MTVISATRACAAAFAGFAMCANIALAQDEPSSNAGTQKQRPTLEEVVVTAQKRVENIRDVPISITAMSEDFLDDAGITDINELSQAAPNLIINASPYTGFVALRGLGSGNNKGFERSVALVIDGVYYGRQDYLFEALADVERVEVLRGPQGTLFGKNAIAGALNITTARATPEFTGDVAVLGGTDNRQRIRFAVGGALIEDVINARLAWDSDSFDGPVKNTTADLDRDDFPQVQDIDDHARSRDNQIGRLRLDFPGLSESLDISTTATWARVFGNGTGSELTAATDATLDVYRRYDPATEADSSNQQTATNSEQDTEREGWSYSLQADYEWGEYILTGIVSYSEFDRLADLDADFGPTEALFLGADDTYEQESLELRVASPPGDIEYVAGLYYFGSHLLGTGGVELETAQSLEIVAADRGFPVDASEFLQVAGSTLPSDANDSRLFSNRFFDQQSESVAAFGQLTWNLSDATALIFGVRYSEETKDVHAILSYNSDFSQQFYNAFLNEEPFNERRKRRETDVSPKLSVRHELTEEITLYGTYATAFKAGGFNEAAVTAENLEFEPEEAETIEAGAKMRLLGGAATLNIGLFHTEFDNLQVSLFNGTNFSVGNAASAVTRGVEIEGSLLPSHYLALNLSLAYLHARYKEFENAQCPATDPRDSCDISGRELTRSPEWEVTLGQRLSIDKLLAGDEAWPVKLGLGIDATFRDHQFFSIDLDPIDSQGAHTEVQANVRLQDQEETWSLTLSGRNITRQLIQLHGQDLPLQPGSHFGTVQPYERFYLEFALKW